MCRTIDSLKRRFCERSCKGADVRPSDWKNRWGKLLLSLRIKFLNRSAAEVLEVGWLILWHVMTWRSFNYVFVVIEKKQDIVKLILYSWHWTFFQVSFRKLFDRGISLSYCFESDEIDWWSGSIIIEEWTKFKNQIERTWSRQWPFWKTFSTFRRHVSNTYEEKNAHHWSMHSLLIVLKFFPT